MKIIYLTTKEIIEAHREIIKETGGHSGILSYGNLDFLVSQSKIPKDVERAAAILFFGILTGHPFVDGNKRSAYACLKALLRLNGKKFNVKESEKWKVLHEVSEGKFSLEKVASWIKKNAK